MPTIGVIGANGQVGFEVCLFLSQMDDVRVIPLCRTELGSAFLRRCSLECRHGTIESPEEAVRLLADCDLVADFSLPQGLPSSVRATIKKIITNAVHQAPRHARFVYISSLMAFGMGSQSKIFRWYRLSRSIYGATKRYAERLAFHVGKKVGREIYVLRLGQVHGEIQGVSSSIMQELRDEIAYIPDTSSYTVFAFSIAEALVNIATSKELPGLYTLISVPEWSWKEIHQFYARRRGIQSQVIASGSEHATMLAWSGRVFSLVKRFAIDPVATIVDRHREVIAGYLLFAFPSLELQLKAARLLRNASAQILAKEVLSRYQPYKDVYLGRVPGQRLRSLSDSRTSMEIMVCKIQQLLRRASSDL